MRIIHIPHKRWWPSQQNNIIVGERERGREREMRIIHIQEVVAFSTKQYNSGRERESENDSIENQLILRNLKREAWI